MPGFRYSLNASTIRTTPLLLQITAAAEAGYEGIELWHSDIDLFLQHGGTLADIRRALSDHGLQVPSTISVKNWFEAPDDSFPGVKEEILRRFEQAAAIAAGFIVAGPPAGRADRRNGARRYRDLLQIGRTFGLVPAFEYLGFVADLCTIEAAVDVLNLSEDPDACLVLDPFHCHVGGGSMRSVAKLRAAQVAVSHFNDAPAEPAAALQRDPDRVMPGDGILDLKLYCDQLRRIGYTGFLSLELFRPDLWAQDPAEVARRGLEKMRAAAET